MYIRSVCFVSKITGVLSFTFVITITSPLPTWATYKIKVKNHCCTPTSENLKVPGDFLFHYSANTPKQRDICEQTYQAR